MYFLYALQPHIKYVIFTIWLKKGQVVWYDLKDRREPDEILKKMVFVKLDVFNVCCKCAVYQVYTNTLVSQKSGMIWSETCVMTCHTWGTS